MVVERVKITHAPSQEVWYASQIGKQFEVAYEYPTHYEVWPNARKWPDDVALLVPVEDCKVTKRRKSYRFAGRNQDSQPPELVYMGGIPWPVPPRRQGNSKTQLELEESYQWPPGL